MSHFIRRAGIATAGLLICAAASAAATATATATATVSFIAPEKMSDVPRFRSDLESMEMVFREHIEELASKLPAGQRLTVEFLDIDLAGDVFPRVAVRDIRVMKGMADWPRMHLRYSIEQDGAVLRSGDRELADPNYLMGSSTFRNEIYAHEKKLLDDWFKKDVLTPR
jgi:predicted transcriptional regulator